MAKSKVWYYAATMFSAWGLVNLFIWLWLKKHPFRPWPLDPNFPHRHLNQVFLINCFLDGLYLLIGFYLFQQARQQHKEKSRDAFRGLAIPLLINALYLLIIDLRFLFWL